MWSLSLLYNLGHFDSFKQFRPASVVSEYVEEDQLLLVVERWLRLFHLFAKTEILLSDEINIYIKLCMSNALVLSELTHAVP